MLTKPPAILTIFHALSDPRQVKKVDHKLSDMLVIALCGAICGVDNWADLERFAYAKEDWFRQFLELENGIPSHDTFGTVFARLDTEEFHDCLQQWIESLAICLQDQGVHIDGKTLRQSFDSEAGRSALRMVSAWASGENLCLGQIAVDEHSNEITAIPKLLEMLELSGAVVTLDAMHCQQETAKAIRKQEADYILTVKGNQESLREIISAEFIRYAEDNYRNSRVRTHKTIERNHGREELRAYTVAPAPAELRDGKWCDIQAIGMVYRERTVNGKTSEELIYFISSLPPKVRAIAKHVRNHWAVENQLHWSLDVTFAEDASRIRKGNGQEIAGGFRRVALSLIKRNTTVKASLRGKRLMAGWNPEVLEKILSRK
jgi:predicted transposase YbfD/YdcC